MTNRINSLTLKMIQLVELCSILYQSVGFGQRGAVLIRVPLKNASQSYYSSVVHNYANQGFPL